MKKTMMAIALLLGAQQAAAAGYSLEGNPGAGEKQSQVCAACHGPQGQSTTPSFPKLAGQGERYLFEQLKKVRDGQRPIPQMAGQLDGKSDQDLADLAAYFAQQSPTGSHASPELLDLGEKVWRAGVEERGVAACAACHSPTGSGLDAAGFPMLAGQHADYIASQLEAYKRGYEYEDGRTTDGDTKMMRSNAFGLSAKEIEAVSNYASGLKP